eukprot:CAMPEP_0202975920 /NCGR_PEP_ID=MMETSP1396-20130829/73190_1 /ASSEMBLY_ACC=CAM_ASM_000872 /TAXON_ID= /ORGANISM="Pseudokeronopsis sp., Strain Brazil" /LENGTH=38 /DNA_ID= /DNA_START= /DNA_END= /DNA_ORIENTATION=
MAATTSNVLNAITNFAGFVARHAIMVTTFPSTLLAVLD